MRIGRVPMGIFISILVIIGVLAGLVYVDLTRDVTTATVLAKREHIQPDLTGTSWIRRTEALVRYQADFRVYQRWIRLDTATFDSTRRGGQVDVGYVSINPEWARLESQSLLTVPLQDVRLWQVFTWLLLVGGLVFLVLRHREWRLDRWWMLRRSLPARALLVATVIAWLAIVVSGYFPPPWPDGNDIRHDQQAEGQIRQVTTINRFGGGNQEDGNALPIKLPQGFERVELSFIPEGRQFTVIAVDEINEGSAGDLRNGMNVPISYAEDNPRDARLATGTRGHRWRNFLVIQGVVVVTAGLLLTAPLGLRWFRGGPVETIERRRRR